MKAGVKRSVEPVKRKVVAKQSCIDLSAWSRGDYDQINKGLEKARKPGKLSVICKHYNFESKPV